MQEIALKKGIVARNIVFISDLHFDFTNRKPRVKAAPQMKDDFIAFIKEHYADCVLCLAGDYFSDYRKSLDFVMELEHNQIIGFFVLGNHDYWNNGSKSHIDIINLFATETQGNQYFRFLKTGYKYYINDICIIGDTGWTSFRRGKRRVTLRQFMELPDVQKVKGFNPKNVISMHDEWVAFANEVLEQEAKVLVLTHFPMVDFTQEDNDCWWSSTTELDRERENSWRIFGHTHRCKEQRYNNISSQRGYENKDLEYLQIAKARQYSTYSFGILEKAPDLRGLVSINQLQSIAEFYSPVIVSDTNPDLALLSNIRMRGYRRCAANKINFAYLANYPADYIEIVKRNTDGYLENSYIGYNLKGYTSNRVIESICNSIAILESGNITDIRAFITAAVITGYVFNRMLFMIESMRPLDNYDVMRFWLMFLTIKKYNIGINEVYTIHSNKKNRINFCNVDMCLPEVNDMTLSVEEVTNMMRKTPLLPQLQVLLPE